jgi:hypothetical protein
MKNMARLVFFFPLTFIIAFAITGAVSYLQLALDSARAIPIGPNVEWEEFIVSLQKILPLILYASILLALSYTARRGIPLLAAIFGLLILAGGAILGVSLGLIHLKSLAAPAIPLFSSKTLGAPGLILSQGSTVTVVLGNPGQAGSPRAVSIPGRPLIYQEPASGPDNTTTALPPVPFRTEESYLLNGFLMDSALAAKRFETTLDQGLIPFAIYGGALIFLLASLRFVLNLSSWPLANLFSGALVFRGILAFQTFIDSRAIHDFIYGFLDGRVDDALISPGIFAGLAVLVLLYTFLVTLSRILIREPKVRAPRQRKRREVRR